MHRFSIGHDDIILNVPNRLQSSCIPETQDNLAALLAILEYRRDENTAGIFPQFRSKITTRMVAYLQPMLQRKPCLSFGYMFAPRLPSILASPAYTADWNDRDE